MADPFRRGVVLITSPSSIPFSTCASHLKVLFIEASEGFTSGVVDVVDETRLGVEVCVGAHVLPHEVLRAVGPLGGPLGVLEDLGEVRVVRVVSCENTRTYNTPEYILMSPNIPGPLMSLTRTFGIREGRLWPSNGFLNIASVEEEA